MNKDIRISTSVVANTATTTTRNPIDPDCDALWQTVEMLRTNSDFKETLLQYGCTSNDILFVVNHEVFIRNNGSNLLQRLVVERQDLYQSVDTRDETRREIISDIFRALVTENKGRFMCLIMKNEQNICEPMTNEEIIKILHMCLSSSTTDKDDTCQPKRLDNEELLRTNIDHLKSQATSTANSDALMLNNQENYDNPSFSPDRVVKNTTQFVGDGAKGTTLLSPCSLNSKRVYRDHSRITALTRECDDMMPGIPPFPCDLETIDYKTECQDVFLHENSHEVTHDKESDDNGIEDRNTRSTSLQHTLRNSLLLRDNGVRHLEHSDIIDASPESWRYNSSLLRNSKGPGLRRLDTIMYDEETNFHKNHVENIYHEDNDIDRNQQLMNMPIGSVSTISSCGGLSDFSCTGIFSTSSSQHTMMSISSRITTTEQQQRQEGTCTMIMDQSKNIPTNNVESNAENDESTSYELSSSVVGELNNFMSRVFRHRHNNNTNIEAFGNDDDDGSTKASFSLLSSINKKKKHIQKSIVEARKHSVA